MKLFRPLLSVLTLCLIFSSADAQYNPWWQWARADTFASLAVSGSSTVLGLKNGHALFGRITSNATNVNGTIMGAWTFTDYDTNGVVTNTFNIRGKVEMIDAQGDNAGNWYVLGRFHDTLALPGLTFTRPNPAINPEPTYFVVKIISGSFTMGWVSRIGTSALSCRAFALGNSSLLLAVDSTVNTSIYSLSLTTGAYSTVLTQGGTSATTSLQLDSTGRMYIAGTCANKGFLDFNGVRENFAPGRNMAYVACYLPSLVHSWHYVMNDPFCSQRKISLFKNKYLYYTGSLGDSMTIGNTHLGVSNHSRDYVAALMDAPTGSLIWAQQSDTGSSGDVSLGAWAYHAGVLPDTSLLFYAQGTSYIKWGNGIATSLGSSWSSVVLSKGFDGNARWARTVETDVVTDDRIATEGNAVWVSGYGYSTTAMVRMDTLRLRIQARAWVPFVARLRLIQPPFIPDSGNAVTGVPLQALFAAPNPAHNVIAISGLSSASQIQLTDMSGRVVMQLHTQGDEATLAVGTLPRGLYLLTIRQKGVLVDARRVALE